jgi:hypothetical protein
MAQSINDFPPHVQRLIRQVDAAKAKPAEEPFKRSKYGNKKVVVDGWRFDSKHEAEVYGRLKLMQQSGEVAWFAVQPRFILPGGIHYVADFVVHLVIAPARLIDNGTILSPPTFATQVWDAKGFKTKEYRLKKRLMKSIGINIVEV